MLTVKIEERYVLTAIGRDIEITKDNVYRNRSGDLFLFEERDFEGDYHMFSLDDFCTVYYNQEEYDNNGFEAVELSREFIEENFWVETE